MFDIKVHVAVDVSQMYLDVIFMPAGRMERTRVACSKLTRRRVRVAGERSQS